MVQAVYHTSEPEVLSSCGLRPQLGAFSVLSGLLFAGVTHAATVERVRSYWSDDGTTIFSDVIVTNDDGTQESQRVFGGTVDGIGQMKIAVYGQLPVDFVPTTSAKGAHLHWASACVFITPNSRGTTDLAFSDVMAAITASIDEWNDVAGSCSYLRFMLEPPATTDVGKDGKNVIVFRQDHWAPGGSADPALAYDTGATAITTLSFIDDASRADNGTILDTDIEVNSINFGMGVGCETTCRSMAPNNKTIEDLQNTLTHELGHVLGLSHTCFRPDRSHPTAPLDGNGDTVPLCSLGSFLPDDITQATMFPFEGPGETSKRSLSQDDIDGACSIYPVASDPKTCEGVNLQKSGCSLTGSGPGEEPPVGEALVLAAALVLLRLRRRRSHGTSL
jgi:MYXO-CTERM domain-containing protein